MCKRFCITLAALLTAALLLAACNPGSSEDASLKEPIIVWNVLPAQLMEEEMEKIFAEFVDDFLVIHPEVTIIYSTIPIDELLEKFKADAQLGLGPDLLFGSSTWVPELTDLDLLQDLSGRDDIDTSIYLSIALRTLRYRPQDGREEGFYTVCPYRWVQLSYTTTKIWLTASHQQRCRPCWIRPPRAKRWPWIPAFWVDFGGFRPLVGNFLTRQDG